MSQINQFLIALSDESRRTLYSTFGTCLHAAVLVTLAVYAMRAKLGIKGSLKLLLPYYAAFYAGTNACSLLSKLTSGVIPKVNLGVSFVVFLTVLTLLLWLVKAPMRQLLDIAIPTYILGRGVGIIGCIFGGCCHGFPAAWGIYSDNAGTTVVPTVLIDIVASYIIVAYLLLAGKKNPVPGAVAARGILLFGLLRYVVDVLRDNNKLFGMITVEGICGIVYVLTGLILLYIVTNKKAQVEEVCTN